jgi:site-specific DNA-adenine methylase
MKKDYNNLSAKPVEILFALCIYGFNHYIRFNKKGEYNVPVGKVDFSSSLYKKTMEFTVALKKKEFELQNVNFRETKIQKDFFYYFDPPYMITNAPYNQFWTEKDDSDLLNLLDDLNKQDIQFALSNVFFSNGKTNHQLVDWAKKYNTHIMQRQYRNANYRRHNRTLTKEVLITNY